ncbi:OmpH family outer membrane protein [Sulfitobacter albidus]|uniref:OmpH family outer membrane protein n=1 Tax=Sulfitobacter albidus TaxID=2829501 RepID=A0A975JFN6_9RHOB|nr:OmpH family outer membrane protein [Sulfitobacter albidus]QUJ77578.1 OmpH family outer membrane protein [Sulfitobacter albidus]
MPLLRLFCAALLVTALAAAPGGAQERPQPVVILTIDSERLFLESDFGQRVAAEIEARGNELATENRQIETELAREEQELTEQRAALSAEEFRPLADAFDARVQETRQTQAAKSRALGDQLEREREVFLAAAGPVLRDLMTDAGARVILERRTVFLSTDSSDVTAAAIARINAVLGATTPAPD